MPKKCFFETYRFSEDLDFTLLDERHINEDFLKRVFAEISEWIYDQTGIEMPVEDHKFDIYNNPRGNLSCQGKISYRGPISPRSLPRIKLDLTADERIVLPPIRASVFHPYSDEPEGGFDILSYAYEEAFGEKVRALGERTRPRDLYDVVNLFRNQDARPAASVLRDVIRQKCEFKNIEPPVMDDMLPHMDDLEGSWHSMLDHQLPMLPSIETFWEELPQFFQWLNSNEALAIKATYPNSAGETVLRHRMLRSHIPTQAISAMEIIRFSASNRLCVDLEYRDQSGRQSIRRIEPYSLRQSRAGDVFLASVRRDNGQPRSYRLDRIVNARMTNETFQPRYENELMPESPIR